MTLVIFVVIIFSMYTSSNGYNHNVDTTHPNKCSKNISRQRYFQPN